MAQTVVSDAAIFPQDEGFPNLSDGNETWDSAGLLMLLAQAAQSGSYVRSDSELDFSGHDGSNDTVDVQPGVAYIALAGETVTVQSGKGGSSPPSYDTTLSTTTMPAIAVALPSSETVDVQDSTLSQIWLAYDTDGTGPGAVGTVYLQSDDTGSVTAPSHPSVELGSANPDDASADTLANRYASPTFDALTLDTLNSANVTAATDGHALTKAASGSDMEFESVAPGEARYWVSQTTSGNLTNERVVPVDPNLSLSEGQVLRYNTTEGYLQAATSIKDFSGDAHVPHAIDIDGTDANGTINFKTGSSAGTTGAPSAAEYWVNSSDPNLSNEIVVPINTSISFSDNQILKYNATSGQLEADTDETGSGGFTQTTKTADYAASDLDSVWANSSTAMVNVTLPSPSSSEAVRVTNIDDTNGVVLVPNGGEDIDGSSTNETIPADATVEVEPDGTNWRTV